jgi:hypothetical protein
MKFPSIEWLKDAAVQVLVYGLLAGLATATAQLIETPDLTVDTAVAVWVAFSTAVLVAVKAVIAGLVNGSVVLFKNRTATSTGAAS